MSRASKIREAERSMRLFTPTKERVGGVMKSVYRLTCAVTGTKSEPMVVTSATGEHSPEIIKRHFEAQGWRVDLVTGKVVGPEVVNREAELVRRAQHGNVVVSLPLKADAPRVMTYEDAKAVRAAVKDVYLDDCYSGANSDFTVAEALKVPVAWVRQVRGEEFGGGSNEEAGSLPAQLDALTKEATELRAIVDRAMETITMADDRLIKIAGDLRDVQKKADTIIKQLR